MTSPAVSRWVPPPCDSPAAPRWPNRPFSASGARGGSLLTLLVHFGRQLDALGFASTFVAASVSTEPLAATASVNTSGVTLYDNRSSPFAVTRVIPTGDAWNELLALSLPPNWRSSLPESSINLCIDLVARGASQQEDFLLARRLVALAEALPRSDEQVRLALPLAVENRDGPSLYVSVQEHSRTFPDAADAQTELQQIGDEKARFELLVQSLSLVPSTPPRTLPEALAVMVWVDSGGPSELSSTSNLDSLFRVDAFPHTKQRPDSSGASGLTPFANCQSRGAVASTYEWRFPLTFRLGVAAAKRFRVEVFSDPDGRLVASGLLELSRPENSSTQSLLAKRSGSVVQIPPIPVVVAQESRSPTRGGQLQGADGVLIGHLHTRARVWSASSWREFMRETQVRRIVCSNRTGNGLTGANTQPEWFSAILRGLNRNPVASICDEGGVTSVLAAVMSGDSGDASAHPAPAASVSSNQSVTQLLQSQVAHLLAESESQQQQIKRLQLDLEARLQAIKSCGLEMVALQRELQARDEQIARLKLQLGVPPTAESLIEAGGDRTSQRLRALAAKCSELEQERGGLLAEAEAARQSLASLRSLEAQYAELQQAHVAQAALVQRLQRDKQQAGPLRRAVRVQEKVIRQFERTVALQSSPLPVESPVDAAAERATPRDELPPREEALAMRVRALERQLEANARAAAAERSALRLRVAELEAAAARRPTHEMLRLASHRARSLRAAVCGRRRLSTAAQEFDYVIVGGGSAGCVLANRLSADPSNRVLLLEAGPADRGRWDSWRIQSPSGVTFNLKDARYNWRFTTEPQEHLNNRRLSWPRGRVLGGSSSINAMVYMRGHASDYDGWAAGGAAGWSYAECLPYFRKSQAHELGPNAYRGGSGPLHVRRAEGDRASHGENSSSSYSSTWDPLHDAFMEAGKQAGYPVTDDMNGFQQEGFGWMDMTVRGGRRWSSASAYLYPALERKGQQNLEVKTEVLAHRVLFEGDKAAGVEASVGKELIQFRASKEVILSGGAVNSPQLLMLSGVGDERHLREMGIPVKHHLPAVGQNMEDHLDVYVQYKCPRPITLAHATLRHPIKMAKIGLEWILTTSGPGTSTHLENTAFIRSAAGVERPDLQIYFLPGVLQSNLEMAMFHGFQASCLPLQCTSRGYLKLRSTDPREHPVIQPNYLSTEEDRIKMRRGIRFTRELFAQRAFDEFRGEELSPTRNIQSDDEIDAWIREKAETSFHPACTNRMGVDAATSVVDPETKVHGLRNLRVIDASIMPSVVSGNLNAPTIMMAEKAADMVLGNKPLVPEHVPVYESPNWQTSQR